MTAPPWGHKPPPVDDPERYWGSRPPVPSERALYWVRRLTVDGSWRGNRRLRRSGRHEAAAILGVYVWEWEHVLSPLVDAEWRARCRA